MRLELCFRRRFDEVDDLLTLDLVNDFGLNARVLDQWCANLWLVATQHQNFVELNFFAGTCRNTFNPEHIAGLYFVLLTASLDDRKHCVFLHIAASCGPRFRVFRTGIAAASTSNSAPLGRH